MSDQSTSIDIPVVKSVQMMEHLLETRSDKLETVKVLSTALIVMRPLVPLLYSGTIVRFIDKLEDVLKNEVTDSKPYLEHFEDIRSIYKISPEEV